LTSRPPQAATPTAIRRGAKRLAALKFARMRDHNIQSCVTRVCAGNGRHQWFRKSYSQRHIVKSARAKGLRKVHAAFQKVVGSAAVVRLPGATFAQVDRPLHKPEKLRVPSWHTRQHGLSVNRGWPLTKLSNDQLRTVQCTQNSPSRSDPGPRELPRKLGASPDRSLRQAAEGNGT